MRITVTNIPDAEYVHQLTEKKARPYPVRWLGRILRKRSRDKKQQHTLVNPR